MDYTALAAEFMETMFILHKARPQKKFMESIQGEWFILQYIAMQKSAALPCEISGEMGVSSARVAAALKSLEGKGLITRHMDESDRRKIIVKLTREGLRITEEQKKTVLNDMTKMLRLLGEADAKECVRIMRRLAEIAHDCGK